MFRKFILAAAIVFGFSAVQAGIAVGAAHAGEASKVVKAGTFEGRSDHVTTGGISIVKTGSGYVAVLEGDFSLDGAPAPTLGFGNDTKFDEKSEFTKLESKEGLQAYAIPANVDPNKFNEFYVWCADFSVPLGVASLK
ncbi:MAG: DM13 domain-containing protein [Stappiaceae bacterium]